MVTSSGKNDNILNSHISKLLMLGSPNLVQTIKLAYKSHRQIFKQFDHHKLKIAIFWLI